MQELLEEQRTPLAPGLEHQASKVFTDWHQVIHQEFRCLARSPATERVEQFRKEMAEVVNRFEERFQYLLDNADDIKNSEEDCVIFYRLLGACRGVSEALVRYADNAAAIEWQPWHEGRF
jgi:hypothetical protein